jgi:hypothetical protein
LFSNDNLLTTPLVSEIEYFSQFALDFDGYRDNNNLLEVHSVKASDNRFLGTENEYRFFGITPYPPWMSGPYASNSLNSRDGGKTYAREEGNRQLFGAYFFMGEILHLESRSVFGLLGYLSEFGGMQGVLLVLVSFIAFAFNDSKLISKSIRSMYFKKSDEDPKKMKTIKFKISNLPGFCFASKKKTSDQLLYEKGQERMEQDLDVFKMVQTIYKLKASIKVLAAKMNDKSIYSEIQESF